MVELPAGISHEHLADLRARDGPDRTAGFLDGKTVAQRTNVGEPLRQGHEVLVAGRLRAREQPGNVLLGPRGVLHHLMNAADTRLDDAHVVGEQPERQSPIGLCEDLLSAGGLQDGPTVAFARYQRIEQTREHATFRPEHCEDRWYSHARFGRQGLHGGLGVAPIGEKASGRGDDPVLTFGRPLPATRSVVWASLLLLSHSIHLVYIEYMVPTSNITTGAPRRSRWVLVPPPPPLFILPLIAGVTLSRALGLSLAPLSIVPLLRVLGWAALVGAAGLIISAPLLFLLGRTTIVPHGKARALIVNGPFRISRNPMYLGLTVLYLGVTLVTNTPLPLLLVSLPLWVVLTKVIPFEEENLARIFGDEYHTYQRRVRRWI